MTLRTDAILERLGRPPRDDRDPPSALDLLARYDQPDYAPEWDHDPAGPRLYRWFARELVAQGYPTLALKIARRGLDRDPAPAPPGGRREAAGDPVLRYLTALAFARGGNPDSAARYAHPLVAQMVADGWAAPAGVDADALAAEALALAGRLEKDAARRADGPARRTAAFRAADWYLRAAARTPRNAFQLGNAAAMLFVAGSVAEASRAAGRALEQAVREEDAGYWWAATAGEACLILGDERESRRHYETAVDRMLRRRDRGALAALLPNLRLLAGAGLPCDPGWIADRIGTVVAFSGHRLDPPGHAAAGRPPRFPNDPVVCDRVRRAIARELAARKAQFGFCSLACGADILFAEAVLARDADLQVVLPFAERDFLRLSVDYGDPGPGWADWRRRYDGVIGQLGRSRGRDAVSYATDEPHLGSDGLFGYANEVLQGMAVVRAAQLGVGPWALLVLDPAAAPTVGGAKHFSGLWGRTKNPAVVIDLAKERDDDDAAPPPAAAPAPAAPPAAPPAPARPVRAMLFADVAGFSRMTEESAPEFFRLFLRIVADALDAAGDRLRVRNTWGDGVFAVFGGEGDDNGVAAAADTALRLVGAFGAAEADWKRMGFVDPNPVRVGLHAGPVFELAPDPVLGRVNYFGAHVNRTARIEPITLPGSAFASEQFAALLTVAAPGAFDCQFVGVEPLAKNYATAPLYQVRRG